MHNPLRSEAEAFRWVLVIGTGASTVIVLTLITRPLVGLIWAAALIVAGGLFLYRSSRGHDRGPIAITRGGDGRHRVLLLANQTVRNPGLIAAALDSTAESDSEIWVVVPALPRSRVEHWASASDEAAELARQRMELTVLDLRAQGRRAKGMVGDADPMVALGDALAEFSADEVIISTLPPGESHWLERDVVERARREIDLPVRHLSWSPAARVDLAGGRDRPEDGQPDRGRENDVNPDQPGR